MDVKRYIFDKLIFPKTFVIDKPGIIINKSVSRFGREGAKTRVIYYPESIGIDLYVSTLKKFGKITADKLWYNIGKDIATRYLLFLRMENIPLKLTPLIIEHILNTFNIAGMTFAKNIDYNSEKQTLMARGDNCVICRETKSGYHVAGLVSGILSFLLQKNIEAEPQCKNCPKNCKIIANPTIKEKYLPNMEELTPSLDYYKSNFPENISFLSYKFKSLSDLLRFKNMEIGKQNKTFNFRGYSLIPSEIGLTGIVLKHYLKVDKDLFEKIIIDSSEKLMKGIMKNEHSFESKIKLFTIMVSALGGGLTFHKKEKNNITLKFINPPIGNEYSCLFKGLVFNGYLNVIYGKKVRIVSLTDTIMKFSY